MKTTMTPDLLMTDVLNCARCREDHQMMEFRRFQRPIIDSDNTVWNFWGSCPTTKEPVLLRIEEENFNDPT